MFKLFKRRYSMPEMLAGGMVMYTMGVGDTMARAFAVGGFVVLSIVCVGIYQSRWYQERDK